MALTRIDTDQLTDGAVTNVKIAADASIAGSKLADDLTYGSNLTVSGNLTVNGTTTTVDTTNMSIEDPLLVFSANATGSATADAGFVVERGDDTNVGFIWDESADEFVAITTSETGGTAGNINVTAYADIQVADITAVNIAGTLSTATQNSVTTMTGLTTTGTIGTGTWEATDVGVAHGGTGSSTAAGALSNLGLTATAAEVNVLDGITATVAELNIMDGVTSTAAELNVLDGITSTVAELNIMDGVTSTAVELNVLDGITSTVAELNIMDGVTSTAAELNIMDGVTSTAAELNILDGVTSTTAELNILDGVTSTAAELNILDGITSTVAELNIVDGDTAATSTTLADADRVVVNDGGSMVQVALTDFETYFETALDTLNNVTSASSLATVGTITSGVWSGTAIVDAKVDNDLTISGGSVDASIVGGSTPAAGTFTTLTANDQLVVAAGATITADTTNEITLAVKGVGSQTANMMTVEISDGTDKFTIAADGSVVISQDLTLASGATVTAILDEDAMGSNSATALATQQSIKAYVDSEIGSSALTIGADAGSDDTVTVGTDTLNVSGGANITTTVSDNDISIALDATITSGITALTAGQLNADNIRLDGNVISTTNADGNLTLTPNGDGVVVISGDLTVNGTTTTVNSTVVTLDDPIMQLGGDSAPGSDDDKDRGVAFRWHNGSAAKNGWFGYDDSASKFTFVPDATITSEVISGTVGNAIFGNIEGTITTAAQNSITSATSLAAVGTVTTGAWTATDVAVLHGGTGSSTASGARANLGVTIGTHVQAYDAELAAIAGLTSAADKGIQFTGDGTAAVYTLTSAGKALLDDANAAAQLVTLGLSATAAELNIMDGVTSTAAEINILDGVTSTAAELNILDGVTSTAAELNILDGVTSTAAELNISDGGTSATSTTLADADRVIVNDNGTMVQVALSDFETYFEAGLDTLNAVTSASSLATVGTITSGAWTATDVGVAHGGTGSSTAAGALSNLGLTATAAEINIMDGVTSTAAELNILDGVTSTAAELNILDGVTATAAELSISDGDTSATSTTLADADRVVVNDGGTMVQVALSDFETYFEAGLDTLNAVTSASSLATVGTITSGTWQGTTVAVDQGGTGATSLTANSLLTGNGTSAVQAEANITYDGTTFGVDDAAVFNEGGGDNDFRIESANQANMFVVDASVDAIGLLTATPNAGTVLDMSSSTESFLLPKGTTVQRPGSPVAGMFRYHSDDNTFEFYNGTEWKQSTTEFTLVQSETYTGDGSTTAFTGLNSDLTTAGCLVTVNGVVQLPTSAYAVSGTTITFTEAPATGDAIEIREFITTTSVNALQDADGDTKIQVEESSDEDVIRFDVAGSQIAYMNGTGLILSTGTFQGLATSAQYADLAERYTSDTIYEPGTVVSFGGDAEVTMSTESMDSRIAGVVSTNPGFLMNDGLEGTNVAVALTGRVPVKVTGTICKGDMLVSAGEGYAKAEANPRLGSVIGKALEDFNGVSGIIEVVVGRL